MFGKRSL